MLSRILLIDDHAVLRAGLVVLLQQGGEFEVVGQAGDAQEGLHLARQLTPDLVLLDLSLPDRDGIDVLRDLHRDLPHIRVLVLTAHEDTALVRAAIAAGAAGYIIKRAAVGELSDAIKAVVRGDTYLHPATTRAFLPSTPASVAPAVPADGGAEALTRREIEVLRLIVQGFTNSQIADRLVLSPRTVETHRSNILAKLHLKNRADLVRYAMGHGLLDSPPAA